MERRGRVCAIDPPQDEKACTKILSTARSEKQIETMEKDFHLLQAALATDQSIISLDETIRNFSHERLKRLAKSDTSSG